MFYNQPIYRLNRTNYIIKIKKIQIKVNKEILKIQGMTIQIKVKAIITKITKIKMINYKLKKMMIVMNLFEDSQKIKIM